MRYITGRSSEWLGPEHFPGPPYIRRRMAHICRLTDTDPAHAVTLGKRLVEDCEDDADIDNRTLKEARALVADAERRCLTDSPAIAAPHKASGNRVPRAVLAA